MLCYLVLDAWAGRVPSWKIVTTAIDGCTPWNMRSFFAVQMVRQRRVIIFMNIGVFDFLLRLLITSKIVVGACIWTCIDPSKKLPNDIERKVCKSFFTARAAEFTIIIEPCFFSCENIPRAEPILDEKPKENFILILTNDNKIARACEHKLLLKEADETNDEKVLCLWPYCMTTFFLKRHY